MLTRSCLVYTRPPGRPLPSRMTALKPKLRSLRAAARPGAWLASFSTLLETYSRLTEQQACMHACQWILYHHRSPALCTLHCIHDKVLSESDSPASPAPTTMTLPLI